MKLRLLKKQEMKKAKNYNLKKTQAIHNLQKKSSIKKKSLIKGQSKDKTVLKVCNMNSNISQGNKKKRSASTRLKKQSVAKCAKNIKEVYVNNIKNKGTCLDKTEISITKVHQTRSKSLSSDSQEVNKFKNGGKHSKLILNDSLMEVDECDDSVVVLWRKQKDQNDPINVYKYVKENLPLLNLLHINEKTGEQVVGIPLQKRFIHYRDASARKSPSQVSIITIDSDKSMENIGNIEINNQEKEFLKEFEGILEKTIQQGSNVANEEYLQELVEMLGNP